MSNWNWRLARAEGNGERKEGRGGEGRAARCEPCDAWTFLIYLLQVDIFNYLTAMHCTELSMPGCWILRVANRTAEKNISQRIYIYKARLAGLVSVSNFKVNGAAAAAIACQCSSTYAFASSNYVALITRETTRPWPWRRHWTHWILETSTACTIRQSWDPAMCRGGELWLLGHISHTARASHTFDVSEFRFEASFKKKLIHI